MTSGSRLIGSDIRTMVRTWSVMHSAVVRTVWGTNIVMRTIPWSLMTPVPVLMHRDIMESMTCRSTMYVAESVIRHWTVPVSAHSIVPEPVVGNIVDIDDDIVPFNIHIQFFSVGCYNNTVSCSCCGDTGRKHRHRKYCCHECYIADRFGGRT